MCFGDHVGHREVGAEPVIDAALLQSLNGKGGAENLASGFHALELLLWGEGDAERVALILRAKDLGFTLAEIRELLDGGGTAVEVLAAARHRLAGLDERVAQLDRQRGRLRLLLRACEAGEHGCISLDIYPTPKATEP